MATKSKLLQAAAGTAAASGGGSAVDVNDVFSIYPYDGTGAKKSITNGISLGDGKSSYILLLDGESDISPTNASLLDFNNDITTSTSVVPWDGATSLNFTGGSDTSTLRVSTNIFSSFSNTSPFTIEAWVYFTSQPSVKAIFGLNDRTNGSNLFVALTGYSGGTTVLYPSGDHTFETISSYPLNTWIHYAFVYTGSEIYMYKDGKLEGSDAKTLNSPSNSYFFVGNESDGTAGQGSGNLFPGYIADVRISNHVRYDSDFTPPTAHEGDGGMVYIKGRNTTAEEPNIYDTETGANKRLMTNSVAAQSNETQNLQAFNSNGFTIGTSNMSNASGYKFVSYSFKKHERFFDVQTFTTTSSSSVPITVNHNLGSTPGFFIIKKTDNTSDFMCFHRSQGATKYGALNSNDMFQNGGTSKWYQAPDDSSIYLGNDFVGNASYVAYFFAHNDGDGIFGDDSDEDIIHCGQYTTDSNEDATVDLGWQPQWLLVKRADSASAGDWRLIDTMREWNADGDAAYFMPNEGDGETLTGDGRYYLTSTGFKQDNFGANRDYIYVAIRRGKMTTPTDAEDVFAIDSANGNYPTPPTFYSGFPVDLSIYLNTSGDNRRVHDRVRGWDRELYTNLTTTEGGNNGTYYNFDQPNGVGRNTSTNTSAYQLMWRTAKGYFDIVPYTGTGSARTVSHGLSATPEMIWCKGRTAGNAWRVWHKALTASQRLQLNDTSAVASTATSWNATLPTDSVFSLGADSNTNNSGDTYIAYLFASVDGVSKVGSYTGTGSAIDIDCGFSAGARFVLIKNMSTSGTGWFIVDTERGLVSGNDNLLQLQDANAELTTVDRIDPLSTGFTVTGSSGASFNTSGDTYIFYAIA